MNLFTSGAQRAKSDKDTPIQNDDTMEDFSNSLLMMKSNKHTISSPRTTPRTPKESPRVVTEKDPFIIPPQFDLQSGLTRLGWIFNNELCQTEHQSQKFERDLMRMLK